MALIPHSHAERLAAQATKRRRLLAWLRRETWTTPEIAADIMGITNRGAVKRTLASMEKDGLVTLDSIEIPFGVLKVIGITMDGQSAAAGTGRELVSKTYDRGRIGLATIAHVLDLQRLKLACLRSDWKNWITPDANKYGASYRPDALAVMPDTTTVCIECERTLKTKKRYRVILANHLAALKKNTFQHVVYVCPTPEKVHNVERLFRAIPVLMVAGEKINVGSKIDMYFSFITYENLPTLNLKGSPAK